MCVLTDILFYYTKNREKGSYKSKAINFLTCKNAVRGSFAITDCVKNGTELSDTWKNTVILVLQNQPKLNIRRFSTQNVNIG